jgi:hypothetical protein
MFYDVELKFSIKIHKITKVEDTKKRSQLGWDIYSQIIVSSLYHDLPMLVLVTLLVLPVFLLWEIASLKLMNGARTRLYVQ